MIIEIKRNDEGHPKAIERAIIVKIIRNDRDEMLLEIRN